VPIYEYACQKCGHEFDALQKVTDSPLRKCPECGALRVKRLVSAPQFRLKGTGWYETDFKKEGKKRLADAAEPAAAGEAEKPAKDAKDGKDKAEVPAKADKPARADKPAKAEPVKPKKKAASAE